MADKEIIEKLADECGGIFRTSDLAALGYNTYAIRKMVDEQIIERIKEFLAFGVTTADYGDCTMQIFDRDRLICECIFYENKMDRETYNKAIQSYVADTKKNVPKLLEYAEKRRVLKKVKDRIGVWL